MRFYFEVGNAKPFKLKKNSQFNLIKTLYAARAVNGRDFVSIIRLWSIFVVLNGGRYLDIEIQMIINNLSFCDLHLLAIVPLALSLKERTNQTNPFHNLPFE